MMKKILAALTAAFLAMTLSACGEGQYPSKALDGVEWDKDWTILGTVLGIEDPSDMGFILDENPVVLTGDDTFYASWSCGEGREYVNAEGKDSTVYDAQMYVLLYGCADEGSAQEAFKEFTDRERNIYTITDEAEWEANCEAYAVLTYETASESNPYHHGAVAFGVFQNYVVSAELTCGEEFGTNAEALLQNFLGRIHYSGDYQFQTK